MRVWGSAMCVAPVVREPKRLPDAVLAQPDSGWGSEWPHDAVAASRPTGMRLTADPAGVVGRSAGPSLQRERQWPRVSQRTTRHRSDTRGCDSAPRYRSAFASPRPPRDAWATLAGLADSVQADPAAFTYVAGSFRASWNGESRLDGA